MPKATCSKCGRVYYGWALENQDEKCECGGELKVEKEISRMCTCGQMDCKLKRPVIGW